MTHKGFKIPKGGCVNGRAFGDNIVLYISHSGGVYFCTAQNYNGQFNVSQPVLKAYCDEICPLINGGAIERRGSVFKITD